MACNVYEDATEHLWITKWRTRAPVDVIALIFWMRLTTCVSYTIPTLPR